MTKKEYNRKYYLDNKEKVLNQIKDYQDNNKDKIKTRKRKKYLENQDFIKERSRKYYSENKEKVKEQHQSVQENINEYMREKRKKDPNFKLAQRIRCRTRSYIRNEKVTTQELVGCDWDTLKNHIETLFKDGMSWDNRRLWEIDHIKPLSSFNLEDESQQKLAAHYTNLQPLWISENRKKWKHVK